MQCIKQLKISSTRWSLNLLNDRCIGVCLELKSTGKHYGGGGGRFGRPRHWCEEKIKIYITKWAVRTWYWVNWLKTGYNDCLLWSIHVYSIECHAMRTNFFTSSATRSFNFFKNNAPQLPLWKYSVCCLFFYWMCRRTTYGNNRYRYQR
jgi:hypothetical protein